MDRNLEKNLRKVQSLREKGQLDKALKQLDDWAHKNPDTPHYLYEAAMVALDLGDAAGGLRWLKNLLRAAPESRGKVLDAVEERYRRAPDLALGEFLVDRHLARNAVAEAFAVVALLPAEDLEAYREKVEVRHRGLEAAPAGAPPDLARVAFYTQLALARAQGRPDDFAALATACLLYTSDAADE